MGQHQGLSECDAMSREVTVDHDTEGVNPPPTEQASTSKSDTAFAEPRTQRLRDPVHGLIVFDKHSPVDMLAWRLIDTPEFQRLRRIKQLGVSEFIFPGAGATRFSHSICVFCTARRLAEIVAREIGAVNEQPNPDRAEVAVLSALLHDLGHGPFSHT